VTYASISERRPSIPRPQQQRRKSPQLLGMKRGPQATTSTGKLRLQLMNRSPGSLIWGVICGAAALGNYVWSAATSAPHRLHVDECPLLARLHQPSTILTTARSTRSRAYRPIPSGRSPGTQVRVQIWVLLLSAGPWRGAAISGGPPHPRCCWLLALGDRWSVYNLIRAPPLKLQAERLAGQLCLGASYIALPWWPGKGLVSPLNLEPTALLTLAYSLAGLGMLCTTSRAWKATGRMG